MNIRSAAQIIRDSVSMDQILSLYGYHPKHGFMVCPFHGDKDASLRVYKGSAGWHCFGCGKGGSVIDFVMEHEGCSFPIAVKAIDHACHLNIMNPYENPQDEEIRHRIQKAFDNFAEAVYSYLDALSWEIEARQRIRIESVKAAEAKKREHPEEMTAEDYMIILTWRDESEYDDCKAERIEQFRKEVEEWRRKARRVK